MSLPHTVSKIFVPTLIGIAATLINCAVAQTGDHKPIMGEAKVPTGLTTTYTYLPEGEAPYPAILYLQGYPCRSAHPDDDKNLARNKLIVQFVEAGFVVHIAEKPGIDDERSSKACKDLTYSEEVAAFSSVLDQLLAAPNIDPEQVYLFGHSMGGQTAPLIARDKDVAGIITFGIHAKPWFEFMIDISRAQSERLGMDPVAIEKETRTMVPFLYDLMIGTDPWSMLAEKHTDALGIGIMRAEGEYLNGRHYSFWRDLNAAPFIEAWTGFDGRVLAMYGEYDIASISSEGADRIAATVNHGSPGQATAVVVPKTGHGFATNKGSFDDYKAVRFSKDWAGETEASYFNDDLGPLVIDWIEQAED